MVVKNTSNLVEKLQHSEHNWRLRQKIVQNLQVSPDEAKSVIPVLYELVDCPHEVIDVRKTALDKIISIESDSSTLISKLIQWLSNEEYYIRYTAAAALGNEKVKRFAESQSVKREILEKLKYRSEGDNEYLSIKLISKVTIAKITNEVLPFGEFLNLIKGEDKNSKKVAAKTLGSLGESAKNTLLELEKILIQEEEDICLYIEIAIARIKGFSPINTILKYLRPDNEMTLKSALSELINLGVDSNSKEVLDVLLDLLKKDLSVYELYLIILEIITRILEKDEQNLASILLQILDMNQPELKIRAALELEVLAPELPKSVAQKALQKLREAQYTKDRKVIKEITNVIKTIETLMENKPVFQVEILLKNFEKETRLQEKISIIRTIVEQADSYEPLRLLIKEWLNWIAEGKEAFLIETTADLLRKQKLAVLPLVSCLEYEWQPTEKLQNEILRQVEQEVLATGKRQEDKDCDWLIKNVVSEHIKKRKQNIDKRIFQLLAEMSDRKFIGRYKNDPDYPKYENLYLEIKDELSKHAIPVLAKHLVDESNSKICELITLTLANNGGFYAANALANRSRHDRKELLTEYYLKPSKKQSEDAAEMLKSTVKAAQQTLVIQQWLNVAMFVAGLGLTTGALITGMQSQENAQRVAAAVAGIGGLGGIIFHFVNKPLERIQNSMADLVQAETAFTSYIWELNLNSAFVQSQYMENGVLSNSEIDQTVERIKTVTDLTLERVETHLEQKEQPPNSQPDRSELIPMEQIRAW